MFDATAAVVVDAGRLATEGGIVIRMSGNRALVAGLVALIAIGGCGGESADSNSADVSVDATQGTKASGEGIVAAARPLPRPEPLGPATAQATCDGILAATYDSDVDLVGSGSLNARGDALVVEAPTDAPGGQGWKRLVQCEESDPTAGDEEGVRISIIEGPPFTCLTSADHVDLDPPFTPQRPKYPDGAPLGPIGEGIDAWWGGASTDGITQGAARYGDICVSVFGLASEQEFRSFLQAVLPVSFSPA